MDTLEEKKYAQHDEKSSDSESAEIFSPKEARRIRRRIDLRLIPCLGLMYGISLMDRKNVSNAYIAGMRTDLDLSVGYRYRYGGTMTIITESLLIHLV
jgi:hypothetical protein